MCVDVPDVHWATHHEKPVIGIQLRYLGAFEKADDGNFVARDLCVLTESCRWFPGTVLKDK